MLKHVRATEAHTVFVASDAVMTRWAGDLDEVCQDGCDHKQADVVKRVLMTGDGFGMSL